MKFEIDFYNRTSEELLNDLLKYGIISDYERVDGDGDRFNLTN